MRNSRYAIFILDSRSDGDRSGTFADVDFLKATIRQSLVDIFAVMGCYINVFRIELDQFVYDIIYFLYAVMLFIYLGGQMYIKNSYVCLPNMLIVYVV